MKKSTILLLSALLVFSLQSCGDKTMETAQNDQPPIAVDIETVKSAADGASFSASGRVESVQIANVSTRVMGHITDIPVQIGQSVKKGQTLLRISNADLSAQLGQVEAGINEAQAAFNIASKDYERFTNLYNNNSASRKELDDITANYEMAKARLESAKQMKKQVEAQFAFTNLKAPFSGVVTAKFVKQGDLANPGMPLLSVEGQDGFEISARIPEYLINQVEVNTEVKVYIKSLKHEYTGTISEVSSSSLGTGGQFLIKVQLTKTPQSLQSGMYATVEIPSAQSENQQSIMIPKSALVERGQLKGVFTMSKSNTAILRWLRLGREMGEQVEVLSGLSPGESLIMNSEAKLYNGSKVVIKSTVNANGQSNNTAKVNQ